MRNALKTVVLLAVLGALFMGIGVALRRQGGLRHRARARPRVRAAAPTGSATSSRSRPRGAVPVEPGRSCPQLYAIVDDLTQRGRHADAHDLRRRRPRSPTPSPPAATPTTRRSPSRRASSRSLDRDELRGVLAHEISHVRNRDILIGSVAAAVALGDHVPRAHGDVGRDVRRRWRRRPRRQLFGALAMMILAPIAAALLQMALSRSREYEADRSGAAPPRHDGEPLARALEKIEAYAKQVPMNIDPAHAHGVHHQPAHRAQGGVRQPVQHAPADRRPHRPPAHRAVLTRARRGASRGGRAARRRWAASVAAIG